MQHHLLSRPERIFVEEARGNTSDKLAYMKLSILVLLDEGLTQEMTATLLGISLGTVNNCKRKYEVDGLNRFLDRHYVPYQGQLNDEQLAALETEVRQTLYRTSAEVIAWVDAQFGIRYSASGIRAILNKLDFTYKKTSLVPGRVDVDEQARFLEHLEPFLQEIEPDEVVYFIDAVHPQHNTRADYAWIARGEQHPIRTNSGRARLNLHGALNAHAPEEVVLLEEERITGLATIRLGKKLLEKHPDKEQIYVFGDRASYYTSAEVQTWLAEHPKIVFVHLPPYSPNLNLIERLWKFLRQKVINTFYYPSFEKFRTAVLHFFENLKQYKQELRSLITPNFQRFSVVPRI